MTINRPEAMNAFTADMLRGMDAAFADFSRRRRPVGRDPDGGGRQRLRAGMDLKEAIPMLQSGDEMGYEDHTKRPFSDVFKPIIAAVNGFCIAGGMEFLQGTDIRIAAESATFGLGEVRWGIIPTGGSHIRLPRQIPWAVAMEMLLTGKPITAQRAYDIGLVNEVVPADKLMATALKWAETICKNGPLAVRTAKEIAVRALALESGFVLEKALGARVMQIRGREGGPARLRREAQARLQGALTIVSRVRGIRRRADAGSRRDHESQDVRRARDLRRRHVLRDRRLFGPILSARRPWQRRGLQASGHAAVPGRQGQGNAVLRSSLGRARRPSDSRRMGSQGARPSTRGQAPEVGRPMGWPHRLRYRLAYDHRLCRAVLGVFAREPNLFRSYFGGSCFRVAHWEAPAARTPAVRPPPHPSRPPSRINSHQS